MVVGAIQGQPEMVFVGLVALALAVIIALTFRLGLAFSHPGVRWAIALSVGVPWVAVIGWLMAAYIETQIPKALFLTLFVLATLWAPWAGWMFFWPLRFWIRWGVLGLLLAGVLADRLLLFVDLPGEGGKPRVAWQWQESRPRLYTARDPSFKGTVDLSRTTLNDFPQFLGPQRTGVLRRAYLGPDWDQKPPRLVWRRSVGEGWGAFAVCGNFAVTQEQLEAGEAVVCYRLSDGLVAWVHSDDANFGSSLGGPGPRATPTIAGGRVYTVGATGLLNCLDGATGERIWQVDILADNGAENISHGVCGSPLVVDDLVIVSPTGQDGPCLAAYDRNSGKRVWRAGTDQASYGSPMVANLAGVRQVLLFTSTGLTAHNVRTGRFLWRFPWINSQQVNCSQPIVHAGKPDRVFVSCGYGKGCALVRVRRSASGIWSVEEMWHKPLMKTKFTTPVIHNSFVYGLDDGVLECLDVRTGRRHWKGKRYKHGQVLLAGDRLIVQAEDGYVALVAASPDQPRELGRINALTGKTWNNPVLAGRYLLVRNAREAACYELAGR
jgi:outer membrane protein assembly factor BamB